MTADNERPFLHASRRDLLKWSAMGGAALGASALLSACTSKDDDEESAATTTAGGCWIHGSLTMIGGSR